MLNTARNRWAAPGVQAFHGGFALPGRLVRVLRPVVQVLRLPVLDRRHHLPMRHCVTAELVGGHCQLEQSEGDFRRFASAIHQVACDV